MIRCGMTREPMDRRRCAPSLELSSSRKTFYLFLSIASLRRLSRSVFLNAAFYPISERAVMVRVLSPIDRRLVGNILPQGCKKSVRRLLHFIVRHFTNKLWFVSLIDNNNRMSDFGVFLSIRKFSALIYVPSHMAI